MVLSQLRAVTTAATEVIIKLFFSLDQPMFKIPRANTLTFSLMEQLEREYARGLETEKAVPFQRVDPEGDVKPAVMYPVVLRNARLNDLFKISIHSRRISHWVV